MTPRTFTSRFPSRQFTFSFLLFTLLLSSIRLSGQCGAPGQLPSLFCEDAPLICLANLCYEGENFPVNGYIGFCGPNTAVHNPQYYQFIPVSPDVEINIHVDECFGGMALQSAIIAACPWTIADVITCDPGAPPGTTMILQASGLVIGQPYWVLIDGSAGSTCAYTFTSTIGIFSPDISGEISTVTASADSVIQGYQDLLIQAIGNVEGAHGYYWLLGWSGDTITSTLPTITIDIPCNTPPGTYSICARAFSGCDTTAVDICTDIVVLPGEDFIKSPSTFCPEEFPFQWYNLLIPGPGIYTQSFGTPFECPYDSIWQVDAYPDLPDGTIDTVLCASRFIYEGQFFDTSGTYILNYPGDGLYGCDSVAYLHLAIDNGRFFIETTCADSALTLRPVVITHGASNDSIAFTWYDCSYDSLLSNSDLFTPDTGGCYCLVIDHGFCRDTICSTYAPEPCAQSCSLVGQTLCAGDSVLFTYDGDIPSGATLHWLIDLPGTAENYYTGTDSIILLYDTTGCYRVSLTIVDSLATFTCVDSFCVVQSTAAALICCTETKCDSCTTIAAEMSGTPPWTLYIDDGNQTDTIPGITTSPYLHLVCPPGDSATTYTFQVYDSATNCPGEFTGEDHVTISLSSLPNATITQRIDTLCAQPSGMAAYHWFGCDNGESLANAQCLQPSGSGCYCVEVTTQNGCQDTACYDFVISAIPTLEEAHVSISPTLSDGSWTIVVSEQLSLPLEWLLIDPWGRPLQSGSINQSKSKIELTDVPPTGIYYLKFLSERQKSTTKKVIIRSN